MEEKGWVYEARAFALAAEISELEEALLSQPSPAYDEIKERVAQIESLRTAYLHQRRIPTWPVDFETFGKFLTGQLALWVGIPTSILSLWEKIRPFLPHEGAMPR